MSFKSYADWLSGPALIRTFTLATMILPGFVGLEARDSKPTEEQQRTIQKGVDELTRSFGPSQKKEAIQKLVDASHNESFSSDERYVVLRTLISFTRDAGDAEHWLDAVNALLANYDLDRDQEKSRLLVEFLKTARPGIPLQLIVDEALAQIELAADQDRFSDASALLAATGDVVRRASNEKLKASVMAARLKFASREKEWKEFEAAKLRVESGNPGANFTVGRWYAVQKQDWQTALPFLERGNDAKWKAAATLELAAPTEAAEQVAIGNAWFEIGEKAAGTTKTMLMRHAGDWYERAEPHVTSPLLKQNLADRLGKIADLATVVPAQTTKGEALALPVGEWIDLLSKIKLSDHAIVGNWNRLPEGRGLVCDEFRYNSRVMAPAVVTGCFELQWRFIRRTGSEAVGLIWPVGNTACVLQLDAWKGTVSGLESVDEKLVRELVGTNASIARPTPLINGKSHAVHVKVNQFSEQASIEITLDDRQVINWQGKMSQLAMSGAHSLPIANTIGVIAFDASVELQELKVKLNKGVRAGVPGRGFWLGGDWRNGLHEVADRPSRDVAGKCLDWNGKKYLFVREPMSLPKAYHLALQVKGRLLTISSEDEERMLLAHGQNQVYWLAGWHPSGGEWRDERNLTLRYKSIPGPGQPNMWPWEWKAAFNTIPAERGWHDVPGNDNYCACIEWGKE